MNRRLERGTRGVALALVGSLLLGACTQAPGGPAGGAQGKPGGATGRTELPPISVATSPIVRELLQPTLTYSGNVQARATVNLVPKISARLEKLNYDIGDEVKAGDVIAELDHAQLDAQVEQSDASVTAAVAKLEQTQASAKQEDIDAAQAVVDQAVTKLQQARAGGRPEEVAAAQATAAQAGFRADQVASGAREEDRVALQAAIDQAEAQQDQLGSQLIAAQTSLAEARYRLDQARMGFGGPGVRPEDITAAEVTLQTNRVKVDQLKNPRFEDIRNAELEVIKARSDLEVAEDARDNCGKTSTTTRSESTQKTATGTTKSENKSTSRQSCSEAQKDTLNGAIDSARANLQIKENALVKIKTPNAYDVAQAEQAVLSAEANLQKLRYGGTSDIASLELRVAQTQAEVDRLQGGLDQASATISSAQAKLDLAANPDPREVAQAVAAAQKAQADLARIANPDPYNIQTQQGAVEQAVAQLNSRLRPFTEQDIRVAAAAVDQAAAALSVSKVQASEAIIRSPFDAVVSQKLMSPGAMASPNTPILGLVSRDVEIVVQVEEARLGQIKKDQPATLSVSAFPGRVINAFVAAIAPSADTRSRTFPVRIVPREQDGSLRDGMFAQVGIVGAGQQALLVPNDAVVTRAGRSQIFVVVNDRVQAREVKLGETDGKRTAVLDGKLNPGEEVVVSNPEALTDGAPVVVEQRNVPPGTRPVQPATPPGGSGSGTQQTPGGQGGQQAPSDKPGNNPGGQQAPSDKPGQGAPANRASGSPDNTRSGANP